MVDSLDVIVDILSKYGVCTYQELSNRFWNDYKLTNSEVNKSIKILYSKKAIDMIRIKNPYGTKYSFYYLPDIRDSKLNKILSYKLDLLNDHYKLTKVIGKFGEHLVGRVLDDIGYEEIEYRKTQHERIGLGRQGIDVWAKHPFDDYYQNFESKNRRQAVDVDDIISIQEKTLLASERWKLPVRSTLVCSFIYPTASKKAESVNMPVVITKHQFVPEKFREFYEEYKDAFGSHYIEVVNLRNPPEYLRDLIERYIVLHEYDEPSIISSSSGNEIVELVL